MWWKPRAGVRYHAVTTKTSGDAEAFSIYCKKATCRENLPICSNSRALTNDSACAYLLFSSALAPKAWRNLEPTPHQLERILSAPSIQLRTTSLYTLLYILLYILNGRTEEVLLTPHHASSPISEPYRYAPRRRESRGESIMNPLINDETQ